MKKSALEHVQRLIKKLSAEERQRLIPFLASLPDSGLKSLNSNDELDKLRRSGTVLDGLDSDLLSIRVIQNVVSVEILDAEVLRVWFFPDNFNDAYPRSPHGIPLMSASFKASSFTEETRARVRAERKATGMQETDEEFEAVIDRDCDEMARIWMARKVERMVVQISLHLPEMVRDMFGNAIKGQTFYDTQKAVEELGGTSKWSVAEFKKTVLAAAWRDTKRHLPPTDQNRRTQSQWRGEAIRKKYSQRVNDRYALACRVKEMYEECDYAPGWMEDLKQDSTFKLLSINIPDKTVIEWAMKRVASDNISSREREERSIACEMARRELDLPEQDIETLRNYYLEGNKLLKKDRAARAINP